MALSDCRHGRVFPAVSATAVPAGLFQGFCDAYIETAQEGVDRRGVSGFGAEQLVDLAMAEILPEQGGPSTEGFGTSDEFAGLWA